MNHWTAPLSGPFFGGGLDPKLINYVGLQIVNDRVTSWTRLVVPLLVLLTIAYGVVPEQRINEEINQRAKKASLW